MAEQLRESILTGALAPGTQLSQERVAKEFGVSRIPARDALRMLAGEGLVTNSAGGSVLVTGMSIAELQELYEMRIAVEPIATRVAVPNVGRAEVIRMRRLLEAMQTSDDPYVWLDSNAEFHAQIYRQANRPRMIQTVEQLRKLTDRYLYLHLEVIGQSAHLDQEHSDILEAVESGDSELTAARTHQHLVTSHEFILNYLLEQSVDPAPGTSTR
ncbi:GntR family transcriptional regulator [Mycobacterium sp. NAZ190054]|nr:GntR family transcriptional regulator [Mycobacterium sp. NAZ190054]